MKKIFIVVAILLLLVILFFMYSFRTHVEKTKIALSKEVIYLKHLSRGVSYEVDVISTNYFTKASPDILLEYVSWDGRGFFYKIKNDSLYIYGGNWVNLSNKTISSRIKFISIEDDPFYYFDNYKKIGLKYFPSSFEKGTYENNFSK